MADVTPGFRKMMRPLHEARIISGKLCCMAYVTSEERVTYCSPVLPSQGQAGARKIKEKANDWEKVITPVAMSNNKIVYSMRWLYNEDYFADTAYVKFDPQPPIFYNPQLESSSGVITAQSSVQHTSGLLLIMEGF